MNRFRLAMALAGVALLAGCTSPAERRAQDERHCQGFGFQPGTDGMANCLMQTAQQREAQHAANQRAAAQNQMIADQMNRDRAATASAAQASADAAHRADIQRMMRSDGFPGFGLPHTSPMNCMTVTGANAGRMICH